MLTGKAIRLARTNARLTSQELAKLMGVSRTLISYIEQGHVSLTSETERKVREAFAKAGVTDEELKEIEEVAKRR